MLSCGVDSANSCRWSASSVGLSIFFGLSPKNMHNFPGAAPAGSHATTSASASGLGTIQLMFPCRRCQHQHRPTRSDFVWVLCFLLGVFEFFPSLLLIFVRGWCVYQKFVSAFICFDCIKLYTVFGTCVIFV